MWTTSNRHTHHQRFAGAPAAVVFAVALGSVACDDAKPTPPVSQRLHTPFQVARLQKQGANVTAGEWMSSETVFPRAELTALVVASWCHYSADAIKKLNEDSSMRSRVDMIVVYEDEAETAVAKAIRDGEISASEGEAVKKKLAAKKQFVIAPEFFTGDLPYYVVRRDQFRDQVDGFPTAIRCTSTGCQKSRRSDL